MRGAGGSVCCRLGIAGGDLVIITVATALAAVGRTRLDVFDVANDVNQVAQSVGLWIVVGWMLANLALGTYTNSHLGAGTIEYARVCSAAGLTAGAIGILAYLTKFDLSRGFFVLIFAIGLPLVLLWRWYARRLVHQAHLKGHLLTRVLISGSASHVDDVAAVLEREQWLGYRIVGALTPSSQPTPTTPRGVPVLGTTAQTAESVLAEKADMVVFTEGAFPSATDFRRIAWDLEGHQVQMAVVPSLSDITGSDGHAPGRRPAARARRAAPEPGRLTWPQAGLRLRRGDAPAAARRARHGGRRDRHQGSRTADRCSSARPASAATASLFECLKFRSMVIDAEARLSGITHLNQNADGVLFKAQSDPRITRVGAFIRRYSIDEPALLDQRRERRHEPRRPAAGPAGRGPPLRARRPAAPPRPARHDRPVAGLRTERPVVGGHGAPRPLLRRQLVDRPGPVDHGQDHPRGLRLARRLLTPHRRLGEGHITAPR